MTATAAPSASHIVTGFVAGSWQFYTGRAGALCFMPDRAEAFVYSTQREAEITARGFEQRGGIPAKAVQS